MTISAMKRYCRKKKSTVDNSNKINIPSNKVQPIAAINDAVFNFII